MESSYVPTDDLDIVITLVNKLGQLLPVQCKEPLHVLQTQRSFCSVVSTILVLARVRKDDVLSCLLALCEELFKLQGVLEDISDLYCESSALTFQLFNKAMNMTVETILDENCNVLTLLKLTKHGIDTSAHHQTYECTKNLQKIAPLHENFTKRFFDVIVLFMSLIPSNLVVISSYTEPSLDNSNIATRAAVNASHTAQTLLAGALRNAFFSLSILSWHNIYPMLVKRMNEARIEQSILAFHNVCNLIKCLHFDINCLLEMLNDVIPTLKTLDKMYQKELFATLHHVLWRWLELHPLEFRLAFMGNQHVNGLVNSHFEAVHVIYELNKKKSFTWPLITFLILLMSEQSTTQSEGERREVSVKKADFLNMLKKQLHHGRQRRSIAQCFAILCRAASCLPADQLGILQYIIPQIETELRTRLFDIHNPFVISEQEPALMIDCFISMFLLDSLSSCRVLVSASLEVSSLPLFQSLGLHALKKITQSMSMPKIEPPEVFCMLAESLQEMIKRLTTSDDDGNTRKMERRKIKPQHEDKLKDASLLSSVLDVFILEPSLTFKVSPQKSPIPAGEQILRCLSVCLAIDIFEISEKSYDLLKQLFNEKVMNIWLGEKSFSSGYAFWVGWFSVISVCNKQILQANGDGKRTKKYLTRLHDLLQISSVFLNTRKDIATNMSALSERITMNCDLEKTLLVTLCAPDTEIVSLALANIRQLCIQTRVADDFENPIKQPFVQGYSVYKEMSEVEAFTGRVAQQKKIWRCLRSMKVLTPGCINAWKEAYGRWQQIYESVQGSTSKDGLTTEIEVKTKRINNKSGRVETPSLSPEDSTKWIHLTGFLCAVGLCCLVKPYADIRTASAAVADTVASAQLMTQFIRGVVDLLGSSLLTFKESVRDTLAYELPPMLHPLLFYQLELSNSAIFRNGAFEINERTTDYLEQQIALIKSVLDQVQSYEYLPETVIQSICISSSKYLDCLPISSTSLRVRVRFAQLLEALMKNKNCTLLAGDVKFRHAMTHLLLTWIIQYDESLERSQESEMLKLSKLHQDLAISCLRALDPITDGLTIRGTGFVNNAESRDSAFYMILSPLLKLLHRYKSTETSAASSLTHSKETQLIKERTISVISVLLSSNVNAGMKYFIIMGYHEDLETRTAFMEVLRNTLRQGIEFGGEEKAQSHYEKLIQIFMKPGLALVDAVCEAVSLSAIDEMANCLFILFQHENNLMPLMRKLLEHEIAKTESTATLFRRNSIATKVLTIYGKSYGQEYLRTTLAEPMKILYNSELSFEVDPAKLKPSDNREGNVTNLVNITQMFLDAITCSFVSMPMSLRVMCEVLSSLATRRFSGSEVIAIGGFIFLRFFCPAIVTGEPWNHALEGFRQFEVTRGRILIAKLIQNISNNVVFGRKEEYMIDLNPFVESTMPTVNNFLQKLPKDITGSTPSLPIITASDQAYEVEIETLHRFLVENAESLAALVQQQKSRGMLIPQTLDPNESNMLSGFEVWDRASSCLAALGPPPFSRKLTLSSESSDAEVKQFMRRNQTKNMLSIQQANIFYQHGQSKAGRPVLYFIASRLQPDQTDMELFVYSIISTLKTLQGKSYEVVVDLTLCKPHNEVHVTWLLLLLRMLPSSSYESLSAMYMLHPSTAFRKYAKRFPRNWATKGSTFMKPVALADLLSFITASQLKLPITTMNVDTDSTSFQSFSRLSSSYLGAHTAVTIRVSNELLQIVTSKKADSLLLYTSNHDIYLLSEIIDLTLTAGNDTKLTIKLGSGNQIALSGARCEELDQVLRKKRARSIIAKASKDDERTVSTADIPGTLLNMSFVNLLSKNPKLRSTALGLLKSIMDSFDIHVEPEISGFVDLPGDTAVFVEALSCSVCRAAPHFTLEVINEFCVGFQQVEVHCKPLCLLYVQPWIIELGNIIERENPTRKVKDVLQKLLILTADENRVDYHLNVSLWRTLCDRNKVVRAIMLEIIESGWKQSQKRSQHDRVAAVVVTLATQHMLEVSELLINWVVDILHRSTSLLNGGSLDKILYSELCCASRCLLRFSFSNSQFAEMYSPELFYIALLLAAAGPVNFRLTIYGVVVNVVNSIALGTPVAHTQKLSTLQQRLLDLADEKSKLVFGLTGSTSNPYADTIIEHGGTLQDQLPWKSWQSLLIYLLNVFHDVCPDDKYPKFRQRLMQLLELSAFNDQSFFRPRSIACYGYVLEGKVAQPVAHNLVRMLRSALEQKETLSVSFVTSVLFCIMHTVPNISNRKHLSCFFWLGVCALCRMDNVQVQDIATSLLDEILRTLDDHGYFRAHDIELVLMKGTTAYTTKLGDTMGLSFTNNFAFALVGLLVHGLRRPECKQPTIALLLRCLHISRNYSIEDKKAKHLLGFLAPFMSFPLDDLLQAVAISGIEIEQPDFVSLPDVSDRVCRVFSMIPIPDTNSATLMLAFLVFQLKHSKSSEEQIQLYKHLAEATTVIPVQFSLIVDELLPKIDMSIAQMHSLDVTDAAGNLLKAIVTNSQIQEQVDQLRSNHRQIRNALETLGFVGIVNIFDPARKAAEASHILAAMDDIARDMGE